MKKITTIMILFLMGFTFNTSYASANKNCTLDNELRIDKDGIGHFVYGRKGGAYGKKKAKVNPYFCKNTDKFIKEGYGSYDCYGNATCTDNGLWHGTTLMKGTWTSWWKGVSEYCMKEGYWSKSNAENLCERSGRSNKVIFSIGGDKEKHDGKLVGKKDNQYLSIEGTRNTSNSRRVQSGGFNSPFVYFYNKPKGNIKFTIDSEWNMYDSMIPDFNTKNGWDLKSDGKNISVDGQKTDNLFYKLSVKKIDLTRNGQNFSSKNELVQFLKNSEFFDKLGFTDIQKQNSLEYIIPEIENNSNNYYLTILDNDSINNISTLNINPKPENLVRKYFAIYPTNTPVKTNGSFNYPKTNTKTNNLYTTVETGEFYIDNDMFVLWK